MISSIVRSVAPRSCATAFASIACRVSSDIRHPTASAERARELVALGTRRSRSAATLARQRRSQVSWEPMSDESQRRIGVFGATLVGLGGILGGGMLILAGTAFNSAGPAAILALALNGVVAWLTAMSVTEMSTVFPESGGAYTFAKKVLSVRAAFAVGWILWFAYIVAAVLYALGFAAFTVILLGGVCDGLDLERPSWL